MPRNLVLVGFMGSGKTAVGRRVAPSLGLEFVDLDDAIVAAAGKSIAAIFREDGEAVFRRLESKAVARASAGRGQVIAPGGGAVIDDENWRRLLDGNLVVRLVASPTAILRRIRREVSPDQQDDRPPEIRPLAGVEPAAAGWSSAARGRVMALIQQREPRYAEAPHAVNTTGRTLDAVVGAVERLAREHGVGAVSA